MDKKVLLSTLWIVVLFNIVVADIVGFFNPGTLERVLTGSVGFEITQQLLLIFSLLLEIPIMMVLLSRVLKNKANRWANIIASVITILFVIGGGNTSLSYIFFASVEILCMLAIIQQAWKLPREA